MAITKSTAKTLGSIAGSRSNAIHGHDAAERRGRLSYNTRRQNIATWLIDKGNPNPTERDIDCEVSARMKLLRWQRTNKGIHAIAHPDTTCMYCSPRTMRMTTTIVCEACQQKQKRIQHSTADALLTPNV